MKTLVIYHRSDLDGICSREIARRAVPEAQLLGFEYGDPEPDLFSYSTVYMIDISLSAKTMAENASKIVWIDHHISKMKELSSVSIPGYRIDGVAACRLAWHYFHEWLPYGTFASKEMFIDGKVNEPKAVQLLGMFDIWDKRFPEVDWFQLGIQSEQNPDWDLLLATPKLDDQDAHHNQTSYVYSLIHAGKTIQHYNEVVSAEIVTQRGFDVQWEGLKFRALNIAKCNSMTFLAALTPEHDACLAYFWNGKHWKFSLYHVPGKEHHDLSKIAVKYGGGGHRGACGFEISTEKLLTEFNRQLA